MNATEPVWTIEARKGAYPRHEGDGRRWDVVVIGGGITGITCAWLLKRAGKSVAVFEAGEVASGVTGRTTAHLTEVIDTRFHTLLKNLGEAAVKAVVRGSRQAIDFIEYTALDQGIACGFTRVPGYLYAQDDKQAKELESEREAALRAGASVRWTNQLPLPFHITAALEFEGQAKFHPSAWVYGLAAQIPNAICSVFEQTQIVEVKEGDPCRLVTSRGATVLADRVVMATNSPLNTVLLQTRLSHYQSYVVSGPSPLALDGLYWDLEDPYHYIRSADVGGEQHLIVGGEDHKTGQEPNTTDALERIAAYARRLSVKVERAWSSQVVEPADGLPLIGRNAGSTRVFVGTGYSGNGMTFGTLAGQLLADACLGRTSELAKTFEPTRFTPRASLKALVTENIDYPMHLVSDVLSPPEAHDVSSVARGEGKLVRLEGKMAAVYRDEGGRVSAVSATCTHLGCRVRFNAAEKTWDCPCHGSRYAADGRVVQGPAVRALAPVTVRSERPQREGPRPTPLVPPPTPLGRS